MTQLAELQERYEALRARNLTLDLTRGKPSAEQLTLSMPMLKDDEYRSRDGIDCRNYGVPEGLPEARELFGEYLGAPAENTLVLGNSSLALMHDIVQGAMSRALPGGRRWATDNAAHPPAMLCPVPGYDRHHSICEWFGIRMIPVPMKPDGPDMDVVEAHARNPDIVAMWCVAKYGNPSGITYSYDVARRLANMHTACSTFRLIWDLAYQEHHLTDELDELPSMLELCRKGARQDRVFMIGSTSKVTFAGAGLAIVAASAQNLAWLKEGLSVQTIGPDKMNQLRHVRFLKDMDGIRAHMARHRAILVPKFDLVDKVLTRELGGAGIATWNKPRGGYFVSVWLKPGLAERTVKLAAALGVKFTPAGGAFPYGKDPDDSHIRLAPTYSPLEEVGLATEAFAVSALLADAES